MSVCICVHQCLSVVSIEECEAFGPRGAVRMTIRTVDMQVLIPKASEVSRVQQVQQQENNTRQQEFIAQQAQLTAKNETTVSQSLHTETVFIHDKEEKEKNKKKSSRKEGKKRHLENHRSVIRDSKSLGGNIDIKA